MNLEQDVKLRDGSDTQSSLFTDTSDHLSPAQMREAVEDARAKRNLEVTGDRDGLTPDERFYQGRMELESLAADILADVIDESGRSRWSAIVAEGVSGRLPGLYVHRLLSRHSHDNGLEKPGLFFLSPNGISGHESETIGTDEPTLSNNASKLYDYIDSHHHQLGLGGVLLVTDIIDFGKTTDTIAEYLEENACEVDVATVYGSVFRSQARSEYRNYYYGDKDTHLKNKNTFPLYARPSENPAYRSAIGVEKNGQSPIPRANRPTDLASIAIRKTVKQMSDEWYDSRLMTRTPQK